MSQKNWSPHLSLRLVSFETTFIQKRKVVREPKHGRKNAAWPTKAPEWPTRVAEKRSLYLPSGTEFKSSNPHPTGISLDFEPLTPSEFLISSKIGVWIFSRNTISTFPHTSNTMHETNLNRNAPITLSFEIVDVKSGTFVIRHSLHCTTKPIECAYNLWSKR